MNNSNWWNKDNIELYHSYFSLIKVALLKLENFFEVFGFDSILLKLKIVIENDNNEISFDLLKTLISKYTLDNLGTINLQEMFKLLVLSIPKTQIKNNFSKHFLIFICQFIIIYDATILLECLEINENLGITEKFLIRDFDQIYKIDTYLMMKTVMYGISKLINEEYNYFSEDFLKKITIKLTDLARKMGESKTTRNKNVDMTQFESGKVHALLNAEVNVFTIYKYIG